MVSELDTAARLGSGDLAVLGTPRVLALMEEASCGAVAGFLSAEKTSVGTAVELEHLVPTRIGALVVAEAEVTSTEGRAIVFSVRATAGDVEIARGTHSRVIVDRERFLARPELAG
jgi:predicted thioesterase